MSQFPDAISFDTGSVLRVRVRKAEAPVEVELTSWSSVDAHGNPGGVPTVVPFVLEPYEVDGETRAWDLVFTLAGNETDYYIEAHVYWQDAEHCHDYAPDTGSQEATWQFHAQAS